MSYSLVWIVLTAVTVMVFKFGRAAIPFSAIGLWLTGLVCIAAPSNAAIADSGWVWGTFGWLACIVYCAIVCSGRFVAKLVVKRWRALSSFLGLERHRCKSARVLMADEL